MGAEKLKRDLRQVMSTQEPCILSLLESSGHARTVDLCMTHSSVGELPRGRACAQHLFGSLGTRPGPEGIIQGQ